MPVTDRWIGVPAGVVGVSGFCAAVPGVAGPAGAPMAPAPPGEAPAPPVAAPPPPEVCAHAAPESAVPMTRAMIVKPARLIGATPRNFTKHDPSSIMLQT